MPDYSYGSSREVLAELELPEYFRDKSLADIAEMVRVPAFVGSPVEAEVGGFSSELEITPLVLERASKALARVGEWVKLSELSELVAALRAEDVVAAEKLATCADPECGYIKVCPNGDFEQYCNRRCWLRVCPNCAKAIAARLRDKLRGVLREVETQRVLNWTLKHLVLTTKRSDDETRDVKDFHVMNKTLIRKLWVSKDKRAGASAYLEFGPLGGNLHAHNVLYGQYVQKQVISDTWRALSLKHRPMWRVWVEEQKRVLAEREATYRTRLAELGRHKENAVKAGRLRAVLQGKFSSKAQQEAEILKRAKRAGVGDFIVDVSKIEAERAVGEVVKYVTKLHKVDANTGKYETPVSDLVALHLALKGRRRVWSWGSFYGVDVVDEDEQVDENEKHDPLKCPHCGALLVGMTASHARELLDLKDANNCLENQRTHPPVRMWNASP